MFTKECDQETVNQCLAMRVICICDVILKHPLFKNVLRKQTHELSSIADIIDLDEKQVLFFNMQQVDRIYFVLRGRLKLHNCNDDSAKEYIYQILEKGDAAGLENLYSDLKYFNYSATALSKSKVLTLKAKEFKEIVENNMVIKTNFLEYVSSLAIDMNDRSKDYVLKSVSERLLKYINYLSIINNSKEFNLELSKTDLATYLGTVSSTLSRAFKELEEEGEIKIEKDLIKLK